MTPRGPDDEGVETFEMETGCVGLGNRRLAVIDTSSAGHQPMVDPDLGVALAFNGMIYNFSEIRNRLLGDGYAFNSDSDTEVLLRAYCRYGKGCVEHLRGMFAFAVWDARSRELFLARDRLGIKPLYYFSSDGRTVFASQVRALLASHFVPFRLSKVAIESYLASAAVAEPLTIVDGVRSLPPGHSATISDSGVSIRRWWTFPGESELAVDRTTAVAEFRELLDESVRLHLVSDVPVGVFLSGGLDSSLLAALAVRNEAHVRTLSVSFDEPAYSEETYADAVASQLKTDHVDVRLSARELLDWSSEAFSAMDQPSYDGINVFAVSRAAASSGLKVALSGLGADELFNGYSFAKRIRQLHRLHHVPRLPRRLAATVLAQLPGSRKLKPAAWLGGSFSRDASYELLRRAFLPAEIEQIMPGRTGMDRSGRPMAITPGPHLSRDLAVAEMSSYMLNVLLRDTDAMSMSQSLEVRVPFLDDAVVDWSLRLSASVKGDLPKSIPRAAAHGLIPDQVLARRKQGFVLPLEKWMRREMRPRMDASFREPPREVDGIVDTTAVRQVWATYKSRESSRFVASFEWLRPWSLFVLYEWIANTRDSLPARSA